MLKPIFTSSTVFRPKNPYDAVPLPYVMGTKKWEEHKYAGIYDSAENSEDEQPEQFSSSSSDEQEVQAHTTGTMPQRIEMPQSDSSSLASLQKDSSIVAPSLIRAQPSEPQVVEAATRTKAQPRPIITSQRKPHDSDMFAALRASPPSDDPPSTSSSLNSSAATSGLPRVDASLSSSSSSVSKPLPAARRQTPPKLFDDDITITDDTSAAANAPTAVSAVIPVVSEVKSTSAASQIKRKPVNLFNDDEFHSFMSEIVDKVQSKSGNSVKSHGTTKETPTKTADEVLKQANTASQANKPPQKNTNLFDDSPPTSPVPKPTSVQVTPAKVIPKSLFDDNLDDDVDDFLSSITPRAKPQQQLSKTSLFDDDDDDLDIDDIFAKKTPQTQQTNKLANKLVEKTSLFDDDEDDNANNIFANTSAIVVPKQEQLPVVAAVAAPIVQKKSLFDDIGDDDLFGTPKSNKNLFADEEDQNRQKTFKEFVEEEPPVDVPKPKQPKEQPKQTAKDQPSQLAPQVEIISETKVNLKPEITIPKADLFSDDFSDEETMEKQLKATTTEIVVETHPSALEEPGNKIQEQEDVKLENNEVFDSLLVKQPEDSIISKSTEAQSETPQDESDEEDPILTMVADLGSSQTHSQPRQQQEVAAPQPQIMQMILDEPPDDSEFFQSLGTNSLNSLSASKMFENEHDFFEHSLPDLPKATTSANSTATTVTVEQQACKDYGGLGLFSDVPPDDDDVEDAETTKEKPQPSVPVTTGASTKRIHTIFYDDFSETARASAAEQPKVASTKLPVFDKEPPEDEVDRRITTKHELSKPSSPVKKLQMPNIKINVHALLPGGAGPPKFAKKQEERKKEPKEEQKEKEVEQLNGVAASKPSVIPVKPASSETDNILQCISKTRTRGPARRPSTRRARRENYAKTLLEEQSTTSSSSSKASEETDAAASQKFTQPVAASVVKEISPIKPVVSFLDDNEDDEFIPSAKASTEETPKDSFKASSSFLESDPSDDDTLFKAIKPLPSATAASVSVALLPSQPPEDDVKPKSVASFLSSDEDDSLFSPLGIQQTQPVASFLDSKDEKVVSASAPQEGTVNNTPATIPFVGQKPPKDDMQSLSAKPSSFLDNDEDDDDALFGTVKQTVVVSTSNIPPSTGIQATVATSKPIEAVSVIPPSTAAASAVESNILQKTPAKVASFLDTDDEDDDALFSPVRKLVPAAPVAMLPEKAPAADVSASKVSIPAAGHIPKVATLAATVPFLDSTPASTSDPTSNSVPAKPKASKLFDDSDDDDDIFGTPSAPVVKSKSTPVAAVVIPKSVPAPPAAAASLFDSDSETETPAPKPTTISRIKPAKSLFSDDEDDDDLFGSGGGGETTKAAKRVTHRPQGKSTQTPDGRAATSVKITPMPKPSTGTADNPLADLLDS